MQAEARRAGIRDATLDAAFAGIAPNQKVIDADRKQPEFDHDLRALPGVHHVRQARRPRQGRLRRQPRPVRRVAERYRVDAQPIAGIWGLESNFGTDTGSYNVIEALATLAWEGRRAAFFRSQLIAR